MVNITKSKDRLSIEKVLLPHDPCFPSLFYHDQTAQLIDLHKEMSYKWIDASLKYKDFMMDARFVDSDIMLFSEFFNNKNVYLLFEIDIGLIGFVSLPNKLDKRVEESIIEGMRQTFDEIMRSNFKVKSKVNYQQLAQSYTLNRYAYVFDMVVESTPKEQKVSIAYAYDTIHAVVPSKYSDHTISLEKISPRKMQRLKSQNTLILSLGKLNSLMKKKIDD